MVDKIETFGKSVFQHGRHNNRVYLMTLHSDDSVRIIPYLDDLALSRGYTKIFAKVPLSAKNLFLEHDYAVEASIPGFYAGKETALFMGKYFCRQRQEERRPELVEEIIRTAQEKGAHGGASKRHEATLCRRAEEQDVEEMAGLYREVFATYPFPIHDPAYLKTTMTKSVVYFGIWQEGAGRLSARYHGKGYACRRHTHRLYDCQGLFFWHEHHLCPKGIPFRRYPDQQHQHLRPSGKYERLA